MGFGAWKGGRVDPIIPSSVSQIWLGWLHPRVFVSQCVLIRQSFIQLSVIFSQVFCIWRDYRKIVKRLQIGRWRLKRWMWTSEAQSRREAGGKQDETKGYCKVVHHVIATLSGVSTRLRHSNVPHETRTSRNNAMWHLPSLRAHLIYSFPWRSWRIIFYDRSHISIEHVDTAKRKRS